MSAILLVGCGRFGFAEALRENDADGGDARVLSEAGMNDGGIDAGEDATIDIDAMLPDAEPPDATLPDGEVPDADAAVPDAAVPDATVPDAAVPDAAVPDAEIPDADAEIPDADAEIPDADVPDADANVPDADANVPDADAMTPPTPPTLAPGPWAHIGAPIIAGRGGQSVRDSLDRLYVASYFGFLRVTPGAASYEMVASAVDLGASGFAGAPLVLADDRVLVQGGREIYVYDPTDDSLTILASLASTDLFGPGLLGDDEGSTLALREGVVVRSGATTTIEDHPCATFDYALFDDASCFGVYSDALWACDLTGFGGCTLVAAGLTDGYGLAYSGTAFYVAHGNTSPATVWRVDPDGTVTEAGVVPFTVVSIVADTTGRVFVTGIESHDVYEVLPEGGAVRYATCVTPGGC